MGSLKIIFHKGQILTILIVEIVNADIEYMVNLIWSHTTVHLGQSSIRLMNIAREFDYFFIKCFIQSEICLISFKIYVYHIHTPYGSSVIFRILRWHVVYVSIALLQSCITILIARLAGLTWGPSGAGMGPMLAPLTFLSGKYSKW